MRGSALPLLLAVAAAGCGGTTAPPDLPAWEKHLPPASVYGARRGLQPARGIVHLHSPYSHDACDNRPRGADGAPNEPCLADLRAALCSEHIDYAALTDHDDTMADEDFATLFSMRGGDEPVMSGADQVASRILCDDGHEVLVTVGGENDLMPIMLDRHVAGTVAERHAIYNGTDAAAVAAYRAAGGLVWVAHTESKSLAMLREVVPDGIEVYNLHANLDPNIRVLLGLEPGGAIAAAANFADTNPGHPEPDLALLSFLAPNEPARTAWNELLADGLHIAATAGSDAHQNAIPIALADGERGDSYRRVLRWFGNIALVADPHDPQQIEAALKAGRVMAVFEMLGTPEGLDIRATSAVKTYELGDTVPAGEGAMLAVDAPRVRALDPGLPVPTVRIRVLRIDPATRAVTEVGRADDANVAVPAAAPGAYRVEISIIPRHVGPYLGDLGPAMADREYPWVYASPIYVQ
ncbi:MAG: hypothetical protein KF773_15835 [Deltaproteobacteria bacterium]|nr:hypothetical protein [Deltaproteobacteria bacterium]